MLIFWIFYLGSVRNPSEWFFLLSLFLGLSQPILAWKESIMFFFFFFNFLNFFSYFFGVFYFGSGRNSSKRFFFLFSLFLSHSHPILAWKEAMMVFSNFLNFFGIFYYGSCRNTSKWFFFFYFLSFSTFPNLFWLEKKLWRWFLIFWIFLLFFGIFY